MLELGMLQPDLFWVALASADSAYADASHVIPSEQQALQCNKQCDSATYT